MNKEMTKDDVYDVRDRHEKLAKRDGVKYNTARPYSALSGYLSQDEKKEIECIAKLKAALNKKRRIDPELATKLLVGLDAYEVNFHAKRAKDKAYMMAGKEMVNPDSTRTYDRILKAGTKKLKEINNGAQREMKKLSKIKVDHKHRVGPAITKYRSMAASMITEIQLYGTADSILDPLFERSVRKDSGHSL